MLPQSKQTDRNFFSSMKVLTVSVRNWLQTNRWKLFSLAMIYILLQWKDLSFRLEMNTADHPGLVSQVSRQESTAPFELVKRIARFLKKLLPIERQVEERMWSSSDEKNNLSVNSEEHFSMFSIGDWLSPAQPAAVPKMPEKEEVYVRRFAAVAQAEMDKFGIPASIILAQGILETDAGQSRLARDNHNHFGIKCFSRSCQKGHCSNHTDDTHKDFFRRYENAWESYRSHSLLLKNPRYEHLFKLDKSDYRGWAKGLKKAGYATDEQYAEKLIKTIEALRLFEYDR